MFDVYLQKRQGNITEAKGRTQLQNADYLCEI